MEGRRVTPPHKTDRVRSSVYCAVVGYFHSNRFFSSINIIAAEPFTQIIHEH